MLSYVDVKEESQVVNHEVFAFKLHFNDMSFSHEDRSLNRCGSQHCARFVVGRDLITTQN
jgi:hypothetical protein